MDEMDVSTIIEVYEESLRIASAILAEAKPEMTADQYRDAITKNAYTNVCQRYKGSVGQLSAVLEELRNELPEEKYNEIMEKYFTIPEADGEENV